MKISRRFTLTCIVAALTAAQVELAAQAAEPLATGQDAAAASTEVAQPAFSQEQIEQMVAPIALYPDALLVQVLMSSTYPLEIVQASRWVKRNADLKGAALDTALLERPWDPSVKTMVMFPTVLQRMNDNLDWTQDLGDAFLAQEQDVTEAVQRLRHEAQSTGALRDTEQQKVVVEKETIIVQPADPQTVYVPTYDPSQVYGTPAPSTVYYPTVYQQPVYTSTSSSDQWVSFGVGALVGSMLTAAIIWNRNDYRVYHYGPGYWGGGWGGPRYGSSGWNSYRNTNINIAGDVNIGNRQLTRQANRWEHNVEHRGGVKYKNRETVAARHPEVNRARPAGGIDRDTARGRDRQRPTTLPATADRRPAGGVGDRERPGASARPGERPQVGGGDRARPQTRPAERPMAGGGDRARPETRPAERPKAGGEREKLAQRPETREARPAQRPETREARPAQRTETREARPQQQARAPERSVSRAPEGRKSSAFQSSGGGGSFERQASARGASSRGSGGMRTSGGGGARGGGGGGRGGGGRGR